MSELSEVFGFQQEDGQEPDFDAIFGGGEPTEAPPIPIEEPKTTDIPAAEIPAADVPTAEPHPEESAAASAKETARPEAPKKNAVSAPKSVSPGRKKADKAQRRERMWLGPNIPVVKYML